jgi:thiaminase/transcriptional activator TenA
MSFHEECLARSAGLWQAMLAHPFLKETAACRIPDAVFGNWLRQDYLFVREGIRFICALAARAPETLRRPLASAIPALEAELELFARMAHSKQIDLEDVTMAPTCHAYVQFLHATAWQASFEEGFTLLYGAEKAYFDSWRSVRDNLAGVSPWQPFIERWAGEEFAQWVSWLETTLDELAASSPAALRERMDQTFLLTARYELRFWEMAYRGESWPE